MSNTRNGIRRLLEQRASTWEQAKAMIDAADGESRALNAEEQQSWDRLMADINAMDTQRRSLEDAMASEQDAVESLRRLDAAPKDPAAAGADAQGESLRKWVSGEGGKAFEVRAGRPMGAEDFRTLSKLSAGAGANTVPTSFYDRLMGHLIEVSGVLAAGPTILNTTSGEQIQIPKTTAHSTAALTAEAGTISASDPAFGQVPLDAYKYAALIQVSTELITDTGVDLLGYLAMQAGRALGNALGVHLVTGTGTSQPNGVVTAATLGVTGGTTVVGAFTADNLIDLLYSVISPYRASASCSWLMRDLTMASVRKLKDTTNQYLWQPSLQVGVPDTLLGKPVRTDPNVAAVALSAKSVLFGDFSQYFVRLAGGIRFERSDDYAFNADLVTFRAILRGDGDLVDTTGAVKYFAGGAS